MSPFHDISICYIIKICYHSKQVRAKILTHDLMSKSWKQATQGSTLEHAQDRRVKMVIDKCFIVVNSNFTKFKLSTHTHPK